MEGTATLGLIRTAHTNLEIPLQPNMIIIIRLVEALKGQRQIMNELLCTMYKK
jgi:hypothetical protein